MKWMLALIGYLVTSQVFAQGPTVLDPCRDDLSQFCSNIQPGGGRLLQCLNSHSQKLSTSCKSRTTHLIAVVKDLRNSCNNDLLRFCDNLEPGEGRLVSCLRQHRKELSISCQFGIDNMKIARQDMLNSQLP